MVQNKTNSPNKALVLYYSLFGNTKIVAESLTKGLVNSGIETDCLHMNDVKIADLPSYDFIALGAPTHNTGAPKEVKTFVESFATLDLSKIFFFTFDTRYKMFLNNPKWKMFENSASKIIEQILVNLKAKIIYPRSSAIVKKKKGPLSLEAVSDFTQIGSEIALLLKQQIIPSNYPAQVLNKKNVQTN